jgi:hypothetical protein
MLQKQKSSALAENFDRLRKQETDGWLQDKTAAHTPQQPAMPFSFSRQVILVMFEHGFTVVRAMAENLVTKILCVCVVTVQH